MSEKIKPILYELTINKEQAETLVKALDMYSRIGMGQLENITDHPDVHKRIMDSDIIDSIPDAWSLFNKAKRVLFDMDSNASHGIYSDGISDINRIAWDIQRVVRHRLAWDSANNPPKRNWNTMMSVNYDTPNKSSQLPLPTIKRVELE